MGLAIDSAGYFIDGQGSRLPHGNDNPEAWRTAIENARTAAQTRGERTGDLPPPPEETSYVVVEEGDCLWTIAEDAGVDPVELSYSDNAQFQDPDVIQPGDIVFLHRTPPAAEQPPTDPALAEIETAADAGDRTAVRTGLSTYVGGVNGDGAAAAFESVSAQDWGSSSDLVMQELHNVVLWHIETQPDMVSAVGSETGAGTYLQDYVKSYLEALPDICTAEDPLGPRRTAANALMQHEWANPDYTTAHISAVCAELGISV